MLKDQLQYEFCILGICTVADVQTLRRLFRSIVFVGFPVDLRNLSSLGLENLYGSVGSKIVELQSLVTQPKSSLSFFDTTFQNQGFSPQCSFDPFDNLGTVPFEHYDFA